MRIRCLACLVVLGLTAGAMAQWRSDRPVRGVWLRPPNSLSELETRLQGFARAGLTDLYLETFYHGVSTGKQGVFNARFSFDYFAFAIEIAARYGIRMHAWVEAGYWQLGTTGSYNFLLNPEWRAINLSTGQPGGDSAGQVFANLCHPGVQAKLRAYTRELAQYDAIWGIQTDYHRFPVDNVTTDAFTAPWGYDSWSNTAFQTQAGTSAIITSNARQPGDAFWTSFLTWRRNGVSEAARQMYLGVQDGSNNVVFSGAIFASAFQTTNTSQLSKCQNWPAWCSGGYLDQVAPMAYYNNTTSIQSDLVTTRNNASGKKVVAGLGILPGRPAATAQLTTAKNNQIEDFILWEGNSIDSAMESSVRAWLQTTATPLRGDLDGDGVLSNLDYNQFLATYGGSPIVTTSTNRLNWDGDTDIDSADHRRMRESIARYRIGEFGRINDGWRRQLDVARNSAPGTNAGGVKNLFDYDLDGDVDDNDEIAMEEIAWTGNFAFGQLILPNYLGSLVGQTVTFEWVQNNTVVNRWSETLRAGNRFIIPAPSNGSFSLRLKVGAFLRRAISVSAGSNDLSGLVLTLIAGDVDGSGEIDAADIDAIVAAFGTSNPLADVDGSGEVDAADIDLAISRFGQIDD